MAAIKGLVSGTASRKAGAKADGSLTPQAVLVVKSALSVSMLTGVQAAVLGFVLAWQHARQAGTWTTTAGAWGAARV